MNTSQSLFSVLEYDYDSTVLETKGFVLRRKIQIIVCVVMPVSSADNMG